MKYFYISLIILFFSFPAWGNEADLIVGVKPAAPFIEIDENGGVSGFSVDLIQYLASRLEPPRTLRFHVDPDIPTHLSSVREGRVDLAIAATTITSDREKMLDFSQPFFKADLGVLIRDQKNNMEILTGFFLSKEFLLIVAGVFSFAFLAGNLIWFSERNKQFSSNYFHGVVQGMWWTIVTVTTLGHGELYPKNTTGKLIAITVILSGVILFVVATASLTSMLTIQQLNTSISSPRDLYKHTIAVVEKTNTVNILKRLGMGWKNQEPVANLEEALKLLEQGKVQAIVHDRPMLQYLIRDKKRGRFMILDQGFAPAFYGILFPPGSALRKPFNILLLSAMEGGEDSDYYRFRRKWFGQ